MNQKVKAVIFDMDGLMFDTESAYFGVFSTMAISRGKTHTTQFHHSLMGKRSTEVIDALKREWGDQSALEVLTAEQDALLVQAYKSSVEKLKGLDTLISFLKKNSISRCIGTSSRRFLVDLLLSRFGLVEEFDFVVSGDMVSKGKPDPEIYLKCLSNFNLSGDSVLVLEDSLAGVRAAIIAGCSVCAIPSQYTANNDFATATLMANSLDDPALTNFIVYS